MNNHRVTVFGGSSPRPGEPAYQEALFLGSLLGKAGHTVLTGGYVGTMEAVSRGAKEAGGHVIGVTCDEIESWRPILPNPWIDEEQRYPTLRERLFALIAGCDAALALPGGIGTLAEISMLWSSMQTNGLSPRPLILIGTGWKRTIDMFFETLGTYIHPQHQKLLSFSPDVRPAFDQLQAFFQPGG